MTLTRLSELRTQSPPPATASGRPAPGYLSVRTTQPSAGSWVEYRSATRTTSTLAIYHVCPIIEGTPYSPVVHSYPVGSPSPPEI